MARYTSRAKATNSRREARQSSKDFVKHSGCKMGTSKENNKSYIQGWNASKKRGFITLIACPNSKANSMKKDGSEIRNGKGQLYGRWTAKVTFRDSGEIKTLSALYNESTRKLYIPALGMVANPSARNGGYFGTSQKP